MGSVAGGGIVNPRTQSMIDDAFQEMKRFVSQTLRGEWANEVHFVVAEGVTGLWWNGIGGDDHQPQKKWHQNKDVVHFGFGWSRIGINMC